MHEFGSNALGWPRLTEARLDSLILFSGGRDSTLVVVRELIRGRRPLLCTFDTGLSAGLRLVQWRLDELSDVFGGNRFFHANVPIYGLVRELALRTLVSDILQDRCNLVPLAESLAMHSAAAVLAKRQGIGEILNGFTEYQSALPEQQSAVRKLIAAFLEESELRLVSPLGEVAGVQDVQYELMQFGISPKSIENVSVFADCCSLPAPEVAESYVMRKLDQMRNFVDRFSAEFRLEL